MVARQQVRLRTNGRACRGPRCLVARQPCPGTFYGCEFDFLGRSRRGLISSGEQRGSEGDARRFLRPSGVMKEPRVLCPERSGPRTKDHCDYLLDSIDAQLHQLQARGLSAEIKDSRDNEMASFNGLKGTLSPAGLGERSEEKKANASSENDLLSLREEHTWHLAHLLDVEDATGSQSQSDSVCTEDFADKFKEGLVDPLLNSDGEEEVLDGRNLPCVFGPRECTARDQAEKVGPSQSLGDSEAAADSSSINATRPRPPEQMERASSLGSADLPSLVLQNRVTSLESLGGKISLFCKESSQEAMRATRDSSTGKRILLPGSLGLEEKMVGLKMGISGETATVGPQRGRDGMEDSFEQIWDAHENSISPLLIEDLSPAQSLQTAQGATVRRTTEDTSRRVGESCQEEGQRDCPRGSSSIACLCPIEARHKSSLLVSSGEVRGGSISPLHFYPRIACDTGKRQRPASPRLGTSTCITNALGDFQQPLGLCSEGSVKQKRTTDACTQRHCEVLEPMAYGNLGAECCKPQYGLNSGCRDRRVAGVPVKSFDNVTIDSDLDSVRTENMQTHFCRAAGYQQGHSTEKSHLPPKDVGRDLGSNDTDIEEEEEEKGASELLCQSSSRRRWSPRGKELPGWKRAERGACSGRKPRTGQDSPGAAWHGAKPSAETFIADVVELEESIVKLQQDLKLEEETLLQKKSQIWEADVTLLKILQEKKHVTLELETLHRTVEENQTEAKRLDLCLKQHHTKVEEARADLVFLECKRDACLRELPELEKELSFLRQRCSRHGEVSRLVTEREELKSQVHHQKLQLRNCKADVAAMQEAAGARTEQLQEVARAASELDRRTQELEPRISALQKILSEKELEVFRLHETISALETEKKSWDSAMENLKQEHERQVEELQVEAVQEKARELVRLQEEKQQLVQEVTEKTEQAKIKALQEQAATFQKEVENLCNTIQDRDTELVRQQEAMRQLARKLKQDAEEMVQDSLLREQKKWEADTKVALQMQREALEEQRQKMQAELQEALEQERRSCLALQVKTDDLHKRIQELETQVRLLQGEKSSALEELRALLQEEKAQALSQLQEELEQKRVQERNRMRVKVRQTEADQRLLQAEQRETSFREQGDQTHPEWTDHSLAREVASVCQQLQDLLPKHADIPSLSGTLHGSSAFLSSSHALQALQDVSEETHRYLQDLKQEIETLKHNILQIQKEKEQELRQQQEQLHLESQSLLEVLKDHMVQEHMEDIATLQRSWLEKSMGEMHMLRKQLQEKDKELRAIQTNMAGWKDEMARKLAHKFQAQLEAKREQCLAKDNSTDICRTLETTESEIRFPCMNQSEGLHCLSVGSLSWSAAPLPSQCNFGPPKQLHRLQSQVQALRAENVPYSGGSLEDLSSLREDLGTAYRSKRHLAADLSSPQLSRRSIRN